MPSVVRGHGCAQDAVREHINCRLKATVGHFFRKQQKKKEVFARLFNKIEQSR